MKIFKLFGTIIAVTLIAGFAMADDYNLDSVKSHLQSAVIEIMGKGVYDPNFDFSGDGKNTIGDQLQIRNYFGVNTDQEKSLKILYLSLQATRERINKHEYMAGLDFNNDSYVNFGDYLILRTAGGKGLKTIEAHDGTLSSLRDAVAQEMKKTENQDTSFDFNDDGKISISDLLVLRNDSIAPEDEHRKTAQKVFTALNNRLCAKRGETKYNAGLDLDKDGILGYNDYVLMKDFFNEARTVEVSFPVSQDECTQPGSDGGNDDGQNSTANTTEFSWVKGWNLVPMGFQYDEAASDCKTWPSLHGNNNSVKAVYLYSPIDKAYIGGSTESKLNQDVEELAPRYASYVGQNYIVPFWPGSSAWAYYDGPTCNVTYRTFDPTNGARKIYAGWNFVTITPWMVSKNLKSIFIGCQVENANEWDATHQAWKVSPGAGAAAIRENGSSIQRTDVGKTLIVKVTDVCSLGGNADTAPPVLPE